MKWLYNIINICLKELKIALTDTGTIVFFMVVPFLYPLLYTYLYNNEVVREVPTVVVDDSHSSYSREFLRKVDASPDVDIVAYCANMEEAQRLIREHKAYTMIEIPAEFADDLTAGRQTTVSVYSDMSGLLYYKSIYSAATEVSLEMNQEIKIARMQNQTERQEEVSAKPIEYEYVTMFNPQNGFGSFVMPAVLMLIIQQTLVLGIGMLSGTSKERVRRGIIPPTSSLYYKPFQVMFGKGFAYLMIYSVVATYLVCFVPHMFHLVQIAHWQTLLLFMLPYILACIFFAMTVMVIERDRETCFLLFVFMSVPLLFISGISWPASAIPGFWKVVSYIFPSTFGINGFVRINSMGATLTDVMHEYVALWIQTGIYFFTAYLVYVHHIKSNRRKHPELFRDEE